MTYYQQKPEKSINLEAGIRLTTEDLKVEGDRLLQRLLQHARQ